MTDKEMEQLAINTIRTLSIDAVQAAKSGHSGTPMALAPLVYTIWNRAMNFDPQDPIWPNRDRFVLSNAPLKELQRQFGFEPDHLVTAAKEQLRKQKQAT